ncbi:nucleolar protein dao-5-like [Saccostrea echinata]|uniref:nucleolar protein dao-5-like n=1 Tax=Saccostrea echinata TaxID=191078 RepID=UPI002A7F1450|nr:nucleolar protein dao-5-like [Saccostrea echinata]
MIPEKRNEDAREENNPSVSEKKLKKKKKKMNKEKIKGNEVESPKKKEKVNSDKEPIETEKEPIEKSLVEWGIDEYRSFLNSLETAIEGPSLQHNRIPDTVWAELDKQSPEMCRAAWTKICQVAKSHMTVQQMLNVVRDLLETNKKVTKLLIGNKDPNFPNAPLFHRTNSYNLYTKKRLEEDSKPSFKEIAEGWKTLSDKEKQKYAAEAEKLNKEAQEKLDNFLASLPPEKKQKFLSSQSSSHKSVKSEFADAPKIQKQPANSYNIYTKRRRERDPKISFKEIAENWKLLSDKERQKYADEAKKINEQMRKEVEEYERSLSPARRERFKQYEKKIKRKNETPKPKAPPKLKQRDLKKAEIQYMKEERGEVVEENPDLEEEEVLSRLSEAFRNLDYEEQSEYLRKYEAQASEQRRITEFYTKHFDSPHPPKGKKSHSSTKAQKSDLSESDSSPKPRTKSDVKSSPKVAVRKEDSSSSEESSDDSSDDEANTTVSRLSSPRKVTPGVKGKNSHSTTKAQKSDLSKSDSSPKPRTKSDVKSSPKVAVRKEDSSSSEESSDDSSDDEANTTVSRLSSPRKVTPGVKRNQRKSESSSSESESSDDDKEKKKREMSPVVPVIVSSTQQPSSSPRKRKRSPSFSSSSSSSSSSSDDEDKGNKKVVKTSPKKMVSPQKKVRSSSVSDDETDDTSDSEKAKKDKRGSIKPTSPQKTNIASSLKAFKKKRAK